MSPVCFVTEVLSTLRRVSVPGHALRCGPETSVTSPLRGDGSSCGGTTDIYPVVEAMECGNPEGISKELRMGLRPTHRDENRFEPVAFTIE
jgi:hypothetical protein